KQGKNDKYNKSTSQEVIVNKSCFKTFACLLKYTVLKLGMTAPHHRKDRDNYVKIHSNNYKNKKYFEILDDSKAKTFGTGYDFGSITNEKETYKSKNGKSTIEPKQEKYKFMMGYSKSLSFNDIKILNYMYCDDKCKDSPIRCENGGYSDYKDCTKCICPEGFKGKKCIEIDTDYDSCIYTEIGVFEEEKIFKQRVYRYDTYSRCVHKFSSIIGTRIQMSINVITSNKTECVESDFELKYQKDKGATGLKICGDYFNNTTNILSEDNKVLLIFKRYGRNDIEIKYKAVKTVN
uniref:Metalloendopeptidase n=1 Tax=Parastrongyloides trichosuri TaxID=131310 RepID=A0A0N5A2N8_PARTI